MQLTINYGSDISNHMASLLMSLNKEIINRIEHLFTEARHCIPNAMTLASVDERGRPTQRTIMLTLPDDRGFVFFTNRNSRKGQHFADRPYACACVYWDHLRQQIEIEGRIEPIPEEEADQYWGARERDNKIAAWASLQSEPLDSKEVLLQRVKDIKTLFNDVRIPRPSTWQGYRLIPDRIEFWKAGWHRLHERVRYDYEDDTWHKILLNP